MLEQGAVSRAVHLPGPGPWYDSQSGALMKPNKSGALKLPVTMDNVPSFLRGGYILPFRVGAPVLHLSSAISGWKATCRFQSL